MTKTASEALFQKSGYRPQDVDVVELHDCFSTNELVTYEALGLCGPGKWYYFGKMLCVQCVWMV